MLQYASVRCAVTKSTIVAAVLALIIPMLLLMPAITSAQVVPPDPAEKPDSQQPLSQQTPDGTPLNNSATQSKPDDKPAGPPRPVRPTGKEITYESLLWDIAVRDSFTYFPDPFYQYKSSTSHDPEASSPDDPATWFSTKRVGNYIREETRGNRTESVLLDTNGPGVITRIFAERPRGTLRIYLDNSDNPLIEEDADDFLSGRLFWKPPLCEEHAQGWTCSVPIPYKEHCKITYEGKPISYEVEYRKYDNAVPVVSLTKNQITKQGRLFNALRGSLKELRSPRKVDKDDGQKVILPGESKVIWSFDEPAMIAEVGLNIEAKNIKIELALRTLVLKISFDGEETVNCPAGDFFGAAPGFIPYSGWRAVNGKEKWMQARWFMPFRKKARITLENVGTAPVRARYSILYRKDYKWDDKRSMYFHAQWKISDRIAARPARDWTVVELKGKGVFAGDALTVTNTSKSWWGNGQPKIWVDDETFPSYFGTGMDHYFGFGNRSNQPFSSPFFSRPRCDGPGSYGQTAANRYHALDGIPFKNNLKFDLALNHADPDASFTYATTVYWYGLPGATSNITPASKEALNQIPHVKAVKPSFQLANVIEGEDLRVVRSKPKIKIKPQHLWKQGLFSNDTQLFGPASKLGSLALLAIPVSEPGRYRITLYMVKGPTYGMDMFWINDKPTNIAVDLFNEEHPYDIDPAEPIDLGIYEVKPGDDSISLGIESIGTNDESKYPWHNWGIDAVRLEKIED